MSSEPIYEIRAIQEIKSSYILYLPKKWCVDNKISKGSKVLIKSSGRRLVIEALDREEEIVYVKIDDFDEKTLRYILISLYVLGYRYVRLESKRIIDLKIRREIRKILRLLKSFEIYEEGKNFILMREVAEKSDLRILVSREFNSVFYLINTLRELLREREIESKEVSKDLEEMSELDLDELDTEIDIARLEIRRIHSRITDDLRAAPNIDPKTLFNLTMISNILERIGDHATESLRILLERRNTINIESGRYSETIEEIDKVSALISNYLNRLLDVVFGKTKELEEKELSRIIRELVDIIEAKKEFRERIRRVMGGDPLLSYHITRIFDYITDIAEYLIDMYVEKFIVER